MTSMDLSKDDILRHVRYLYLAGIADSYVYTYAHIVGNDYVCMDTKNLCMGYVWIRTQNSCMGMYVPKFRIHIRVRMDTNSMVPQHASFLFERYKVHNIFGFSFFDL